MTPRSSEGAHIACCVCGARPYPELALPQAVPECFDLIKIGDKWGCPKHRPVKAQRAPEKGVDKISAAVEALARYVARAFKGDVIPADRLVGV
jgi:hypothetical protein